MSTWIPILTGLMAFFGAVVGHFVAFDLNAAAKRREVRRAQIERFAEFISEDTGWMDEYRSEELFGEGKSEHGISPHDKAFAIYVLYFGEEISTQMSELISARNQLQTAIGTTYTARLKLAQANKKALAEISPSQAEVDAVTNKYRTYYEATLQCLLAASTIAQGTIPEKSQIGRWCSGRWTRSSGWFVRRK